MCTVYTIESCVRGMYELYTSTSTVFALDTAMLDDGVHKKRVWNTFISRKVPGQNVNDILFFNMKFFYFFTHLRWFHWSRLQTSSIPF